MADCKDCYFWHKELGECTITSQKDPSECDYANFDMYYIRRNRKTRKGGGLRREVL